MSKKQKNKTRKRNSNAISQVSVTNLSRPTWEAWQKYEGGTESVWEERIHPYAPIDQVQEVIDAMEDQNVVINQYRLCVIDDEYFEWCTNNQREIDHKSRLDYIAQMSDETAMQLPEKYNLGVQYTACVIPIVIARMVPVGKETTRYKLDNTCRTLLWKYLGKYYGRENVYVPGYCMTGSTASDNCDKLVKMAVEHFQTGVNIQFGKWEEQDWEAESEAVMTIIGGTNENPELELDDIGFGNRIKLYIPFVVRYKLTTPYIDASASILHAENLAEWPYLIDLG